MTELERAILDTIARGLREGREATSIYLTPEDRADLDRAGHGPSIGGLPIRPVSGKGKSRVYFKHGTALSIRPPKRLQAKRPIARRRRPPAGEARP